MSELRSISWSSVCARPKYRSIVGSPSHVAGLPSQAPKAWCSSQAVPGRGGKSSSGGMIFSRTSRGEMPGTPNSV
ncbi:MAG: hypothetical protein ACLR93_01010 [Alistipes onderdonkii]